MNRGFYLVLKTALSSRHRLRCILTGEGGTSPLRFDKIFGRVKKAGHLQAVCPKVNFRPPFQRRWNPKVKPLVAPRTERNLFLYISAGGEQKYSGGIFLCGEPSPGVPRCAPNARRQCVRGGRSFPGISFAQIVDIANYSKISIQKSTAESILWLCFSFYTPTVKKHLFA